MSISCRTAPWIRLADLRALGQIDGVLLQRLALVLGILGLHLLAAAQAVDGGTQFLLVGTAGLQFLARRPAVVQCSQQEPFAGDVGIAAVLRQLVGDVEQARQVVADGQVAG